MNIYQLKAERNKAEKELEAVRARVVDYLEFTELEEQPPETIESIHAEAQTIRARIKELDALIGGEA